MRIAAIDQGTTSTRVIGVGDDGQPHVIHAITHRQFFPQAGRVEHDPEELIRNIRLCIDAAGKLDAIGIANQGESCLAWDAKTKTALSPVIVWQDDRTRENIEKLREDGAASTVRDRTGLLRLKFQMQHQRPFGHRMLRWTDKTSTSVARTVA